MIQTFGQVQVDNNYITLQLAKCVQKGIIQMGDVEMMTKIGLVIAESILAADMDSSLANDAQRFISTNEN